MTAISLIELANNAVPLFRTKREDGRAPTIVMEGPPGIGKTAIGRTLFCRALSRHFNCTVDFISAILAHLDPMDLNGVLIPYKMGDGRPAAAYTMSNLAVQIQASPAFKDGIVIVFLDELFQADALMQKTVAETLHTGMFGEWQAPPNVWIIGATNRQQDSAGVNKVLSFVGNRVVRVEVFMPIDQWVKYGASIGLPQVVLSFAEFVEADFAQAVPRDGKPFMTPRSLTDVALFIKDDNEARGNNNPMTFNTDNFFLQTVIEGCIGEAAKTKFYGFAKHAAELPTVQEIKKDPHGARCPPATQPGAQFAVSGLIMANAKADTIEPLWEYATRLGREFQALLVKKLTDNAHGGVLINAPGIGKWMSDPRNKALLVDTWNRQAA